MNLVLKQIVSGGQTGVDRAALDAAIESDFPHGGWCPLNRRSEDGPIDDRYKLRESHSRDYAVRTEQNVCDSDGTLILHRGPLTGGTRLTRKLAKRHEQPFLQIDLNGDLRLQFDAIIDWLISNEIITLNVAGPRQSSSPGIHELARQAMLELLTRCAAESNAA